MATLSAKEAGSLARLQARHCRVCCAVSMAHVMLLLCSAQDQASGLRPCLGMTSRHMSRVLLHSAQYQASGLCPCLGLSATRRPAVTHTVYIRDWHHLCVRASTIRRKWPLALTTSQKHRHCHDQLSHSDAEDPSTQTCRGFGPLTFSMVNTLHDATNTRPSKPLHEPAVPHLHRQMLKKQCTTLPAQWRATGGNK